MNLHAIYHEAKSRYAYAADSGVLHIRLRTALNDIKSVTLTATDPFNWFPDESGGRSFDTEAVVITDMRREYSDTLFDYWFCQIDSIPTGRIRYTFTLNDGSTRLCYGSTGFFEPKPQMSDDLERFFNFPDICEEDIYREPDWAKDTIWYQIFPERFARGVETDGDYLPWGSETTKIHASFFGGTLKGITGKLEYIADLGFNGIYLTPIFESPSTHKYDTIDYFKIDPHFGTNEDFRELVQKAHKLGIRVMLDAVFNHCGFYHPFFQDVVEKGSKSEYFGCFHISREPVLNFELENGRVPKLTKQQYKNLPFRTFAYTPYMPKWNTADTTAKAYLTKAARFWVEEYGVDGWRFDVSNEVSHDFWREMRKTLKAIKPDLLLLGENWDDSMPWLNGDQFDSVMNYGLLDAVTGFCGKNQYGERLDAAGFCDRLTRRVLAAYPKPLQRALFNLLDCHDTDRLVTACGGNMDAVRLAYVLQMTMGGAPSVYYGGEVGLDGRVDDGENRRCMPWDDNIPAENDLRDFLRTLINLRKTHPSMRAVDVELLQCDGGFLSYKKQADGETLFVAVNNSVEERTAAVPEHSRALTDAFTGKPVIDNIILPAYGFAILFL